MANDSGSAAGGKKIMPKGRPFVKGQSGNPLGGKLQNKELMAVRKLSKPELAEIATLIISGDINMINQIRNDPDETPLRKWICAVVSKGIQNGDMGTLNALLDRVVGKVKDEVEVSHPKPFIVEFDDGKQIVMGTKIESDDE